jgi:fucose 4-O-acetylase-like acetyltransferase
VLCIFELYCTLILTVYVYVVYLNYTVNLQKLSLCCLFNHLHFTFQVSPVHEYLVTAGLPLYQRYQVMSYKIISRSGDEEAFRDMVRRCNKVGVR